MERRTAREAIDPPYEVEVVRDVRIPTRRHGVSLAADLYRPVGGRPGPALVTVLPYRKDAWAGLLNGNNLRRFASNGYACLLVDLRGTGSSGGRARPPFHPEEADDGVAAVGWAAAQPWCDGSVGMWGHSYGAVMAMRTATRQPVALKAIVPVMGMVDPERDFVHPAGRRGNLSSVGVWGMHTLLTQILPPLSSSDAAGRRRWSVRREAEPYLVDLFRHAPGDPEWRTRVVDPARISTPAFCIGGWQDLFCAATLRAYEAMTGPKRLLVGPWTHTMPDAAPSAPADFVSLALPWWDRWLRGVDNGVDSAPEALLYLPSIGWRAYDSWPPAKASRTFAGVPASGRLRPASDRAAARRPRATEPLAEHRGDPTAGALGAFWAVPSGGLGQPLDQHDDDMRSLVLTSDPLPIDVVILGSPTVDIWPPATPLVVKLADVGPAGRSTLITCGDGVSLEDHGPAGGDGSINDRASPVRVVLTPTSHVVSAGHRIRIALNHTDFPRLWPAVPDRPLRVSRVILVLPTVVADDGVAVTVPPIDLAQDPSASPVPMPGTTPVATSRWVVARDFVSDGIEVRLVEDLAATVAEGSIQVEREVCAAALPAELRGGASATVSRPAGPQLRLWAEFTMTDDGLSVRASATRNGAPFWSHEWVASRSGETGQARP